MSKNNIKSGDVLKINLKGLSNCPECEKHRMFVVLETDGVYAQFMNLSLKEEDGTNYKIVGHNIEHYFDKIESNINYSINEIVKEVTISGMQIKNLCLETYCGKVIEIKDKNSKQE